MVRKAKTQALLKQIKLISNKAMDIKTTRDSTDLPMMAMKCLNKAMMDMEETTMV